MCTNSCSRKQKHKDMFNEGLFNRFKWILSTDQERKVSIILLGATLRQFVFYFNNLCVAALRCIARLPLNILQCHWLVPTSAVICPSY